MDDQKKELSNTSVILKNQRKFADYFLPKHCVGVQSVRRIGDSFSITARVKLSWQPKFGKTQEHTISVDRVEIWRENISLYSFILGK